MDLLLIAVSFSAIPILSAFIIRNRAIKVLLCGIALLGFFVTGVLVGGFFLPDLIGYHGIWLPFAVLGLIYILCVMYVFRKPSEPKIRKIATLSAAGVILVLAAVFVAPSVYHALIPRVDEEMNLYDYEPFGHYRYKDDVLTHFDSSVAKLTEESTLKLTGELPRLDGATALYPLYSAFTRAAYPPPEPTVGLPEYSSGGDFRDENAEYRPIVGCSATPAAFSNLTDGYADIVFLMGVSDEQRRAASDKGLELTLTPIGYDAFIFFVNNRNNAENLSTEEVRGIYSGQYTDWGEVGGGRGEIAAYQRPDGSGSQTKLQEIMGDTPLRPAPTEERFNTMMGMVRWVADYKNYRNALGYSFLYYVRDMLGEEEVKLLSIDGVPPTPETIVNGAYPFANEFYAVTAKRDSEYLNPERTENIDALLSWIQSPQGQSLVGATGYYPLG
ncbi:MAG: substrate-binding domain-containing protein [Oscillospiraceae bacterium]|jgi:phosphate transport system substrate-binding protein|nr:substrate-binding domain-containing protein [Oscillospiraceae bacterium]